VSHPTRRALLAGAACVSAIRAGQQTTPSPGQSPADRKPEAGKAPGEAANPSRPFLEELPKGPLLAPGRGKAPWTDAEWKLQFLMDEDDTSPVLNDLRMFSARWGMAAGWLATKNGGEEGFVLVTQDGGAHWAKKKVKGVPLSLCVLDDARAFVVIRGALLYTSDAGDHWDKTRLPGGDLSPVRCHFNDSRRGWAWGAGKVFYETSDGGAHWSKVPESEKIQLNEKNTAWMWLDWITKDVGLLVGNSTPPHEDESGRWPDWMMPERASRRRVLPSSTVAAETRDGGKTWRTSVASAFGRVIRVRSTNARALTVFQYGEGFEWPSEVYSIDYRTGGTKPLFRKRDLTVWDGVVLAEGGYLLAAIEQPGRMRSSPIPGKLRMIHSPDGVTWQAMRSDYRAVGKRATIARVDDRQVWVATDDGALVKLEFKG
jgi:photosystem II stability/assembly factor-like uncharacterized protein